MNTGGIMGAVGVAVTAGVALTAMKMTTQMCTNATRQPTNRVRSARITRPTTRGRTRSRRR